jgi:hypothetical protein
MFRRGCSIAVLLSVFFLATRSWGQGVPGIVPMDTPEPGVEAPSVPGVESRLREPSRVIRRGDASDVVDEPPSALGGWKAFLGGLELPEGLQTPPVQSLSSPHSAHALPASPGPLEPVHTGVPTVQPSSWEMTTSISNRSAAAP